MDAGRPLIARRALVTLLVVAVDAGLVAIGYWHGRRINPKEFPRPLGQMTQDPMILWGSRREIRTYGVMIAPDVLVWTTYDNATRRIISIDATDGQQMRTFQVENTPAKPIEPAADDRIVTELHSWTRAQP